VDNFFGRVEWGRLNFCFEAIKLGFINPALADFAEGQFGNGIDQKV
jgi:hypothetical protein